VKKLLKIVFLILFTWGGITGDTDCSELFKLPELITHYQVEKERVETNNFFQFLLAHYFDLSNDESDEDHSKLPFQDHYEALHPLFDYTPSLSLIHRTNVTSYQPCFKWINQHEQLLSYNFFVPPKHRC
jgi:hypothetical protein